MPVLAIAFMLMAGGFLVLAADDGTDAAVMNVVGDHTYVETGKTVIFTISGDSGYSYEARLIDSNGNEVSSTSSSGTLGSTSVKKTITAPSTSGDYRYYVKFSSGGNTVSEIKVPLKVVDPVVLTATLRNTGSVSVTADVFFVVDGNRMDDSDTTVTIPAGETKVVTYNFIVENFSGTHSFYVDSESTGMIGPIEGIGSSYAVTFHAQDTSYNWLNYLMLIIVIVLIIIMIYVYRKPVKNYGKPKGRR